MDDSLDVPLGKWFKVKKIETSDPTRVRVYINDASRVADLGRVIGEDPEGQHRLVLELVTTSDQLDWYFMPVPEGYNAEVVVSEDIPITVTNLSGGTVAIDVIFDFLKLEI